MQTSISAPISAHGNDPARTADHGHFPAEGCISPPQLNNADILGVLFDLFAGRTTTAFGESLDWWNETLQCDLGQGAAAGVALSALSKWPFDQRAGADGVAELRAQLLQRAHMLMERATPDAGEAI